MQQPFSALAPTRTRGKTNFPSRGNKWTQQEDELLIRLHNENVKLNWNEIAPRFPGKTAQQISERWSKVVNPDLVKGSWTRQEDQTIIDFVQTHGTRNWTKLAALLPGRIGKQCRERWRNHLDPSNNKSPWTPEEDAMLIKYHEMYGNQWVKIAGLMKGRSDNSIKNRWNSTLRKNGQQSQANNNINNMNMNNNMQQNSIQDPVIRVQYSTPVNDIQQVIAPPQTPSSIEILPQPVLEDTVTDSFDQTSSGMTPRNFDLISPYSTIRSPFGITSPYGFKSDSLYSPWGTSGYSTDSIFSPKLSPFVSKSQNREPNLALLMDKD